MNIPAFLIKQVWISTQILKQVFFYHRDFSLDLLLDVKVLATSCWLKLVLNKENTPYTIEGIEQASQMAEADLPRCLTGDTRLLGGSHD